MRFAVAALGLAALASGAMAAPSHEALTAHNRAIVSAFAHLFYDERNVRAAFDRYVAPDYIQHNPDIADGRDAAIAALEPTFSQPGSRFEVKQILVDGDLAVIHLKGRTGGTGSGGAVADFYRLAHGKIVEHWDVLQPMPDHARNPHPMF